MTWPTRLGLDGIEAPAEAQWPYSQERRRTMRFTRLSLVGLVMLGGALCVGAPSAQTPPDVSGKWEGTWKAKEAAQGNGLISMTLTQAGKKVTGDMAMTGTQVQRSGKVTMLVDGNEVYMVYPTGITGYLTVSGDEMKGVLGGVGPADVTMKRKK
jgi:hypothetical protein